MFSKFIRNHKKSKRNVPRNTKESESQKAYPSLESLINDLNQNDDFIIDKQEEFTLFYFESLVDKQYLSDKINYFLTGSTNNVESSIDLTDITEKLLRGFCVVLYKDTHLQLIDVGNLESRDVDPPESEATIIGPQVSFNEDLSQTLNLIRSNLRTSELIVKQFKVGNTAKKNINVVYLRSKANSNHVEEVITKVKNIQIDYLSDTLSLDEIISDNPYSIFPQMLQTERVDRVCANLIEGKIAIISEGSPSAALVPHTFIESLQSPEDYYTNWIGGSFIRLLRFAAFYIGLLLTATYVAVMSYHYLIIPPDLMVVVAATRAQVPFSPMVEALLMEFAVEFLREAGSRLPTRIGQTVGIVGGIIIGQAAVSAGLTSNILIIVVSFSMLTTLVIPSYHLSNAVRVLRFGLIFAAGFIGGLGVIAVFLVIMIYMSRLESFGVPYYTPFSPIRRNDLRDSIIRLPLKYQDKKPTSTEN